MAIGLQYMTPSVAESEVNLKTVGNNFDIQFYLFEFVVYFSTEGFLDFLDTL